MPDRRSTKQPALQHEGEMAPAVRAHLERQGYHVWVDPDGHSYFDIVARREREVGLVELKIADWRKVFAQALRRRGYGDWVSVVVPNERTARRIAGLPASTVSRRVGIWYASGGAIVELVAARPLRDPGEAGPFPEQRAALVSLLDLLDSGALPPQVEWSGPPGLRRDRRSTKDFRMEEFESEVDPGA